MANEISSAARYGSRRSFLKSVAGMVGTAAAGPYSSEMRADAQKDVRNRPNILLLHSHDLGRFLNCYGVASVHTPNLDRLATEGVLLEHVFATAPQCSPSRSSIFTGRYPHNNGVLGLTHAPFCWELHPEEQHLGQILQQAGYRTAGVGVIHETHLGPKRCGLEQFVPSPWAKDVAASTIELLKKFAAEPGAPFYLQAGTIEPHRLPGIDPNADHGFLGKELSPDISAGVQVPGYLRDTPGTKIELGELQGSVRYVDEQFGRVLEALDALGLASDTLVIFTTDHGIAMPRAKCSLYDPGLETAFLLRLPSRRGWSGGKREKAMISNLDYLPTILEVVGAAAPAGVQGRSFAPLLDGSPYQPHEALFHEMTYHDYYDPLRAVRTDNFKLIVSFSSAPAYMDPSNSLRPRADTVVPPNDALAYHTSLELYDLKQDPLEQKNLASDKAHADTLNALRQRLIEHMRQSNDPLLQGAISNPMHSKNLEWLRTGVYQGERC